MVNSILSLLLTLAILACPVACAQGYCCADAQFAAQDATGVESGCCSRCDDLTEEQPQHDAPGNDSDEHCQSVCSGAVVDKPCELKDPEAEFSLPLHAVDEAADVPLADLLSRFIVPGLSERGNTGRSLRTLYGSFLC